MEEALNKAADFITAGGQPLIYSTHVKTGGPFKSTEILAITDSRVVIFSGNGQRPLHAYSFFDLKSIKVNSKHENAVSIEFATGSISFRSDDASQILHHIYDCIQHLLSMKEQAQIQIDNYQVQAARHNGTGALYRLKAQYQNPSLDNFKKLESILMFSQPYVSLSVFNDKLNFVPHFVNVLPLITHIKSLTLPEIEGIDNYKLIAQIIPNENHIKHFSIHGPVTDAFDEFVDAIKENRQTKLYGLSFVNSNLDKQHLECVTTLIRAAGLKSVQFHRAVEEESFDYFYNEFINPTLFNQIDVLSLSGTPNIRLTKLFKSITKIKMLSLSNCSLDIKDVFNELPKLTHIKLLDISNNRLTEPVDEEIELPNSLNQVVANHISFSADCLVPFLNFLFSRFEHGLKLSMAEIETPSEEWDEVFSFLHHCEYRSLISLVWDYNPVHQKFFTFLLRNPYFESLSLNDSIKSAAAADSLVSLGLYIQSNDSLARLSLRGNSKCYVGNNIGKFLKYVQSSTSLQFLDMTYTKCGDNGLTQIGTLIDNCPPTLKTVVIDGMKPKNPEILLTVLHKAETLKDHFKLSYPQNDVEFLVKKKLLSKRDAFDLRKLFQTEEKGPESFFLQPFRIFRYYLLDDFPSYLNKAQIDDILSTRPLIAKVPPPLSPNTSFIYPYSQSQLQSPVTRKKKNVFAEDEGNEGSGEIRESHVKPLITKRSPKKRSPRKRRSPRKKSPTKSPAVKSPTNTPKKNEEDKSPKKTANPYDRPYHNETLKETIINTRGVTMTSIRKATPPVKSAAVEKALEPTSPKRKSEIDRSHKNPPISPRTLNTTLFGPRRHDERRSPQRKPPSPVRRSPKKQDTDEDLHFERSPKKITPVIFDSSSYYSDEDDNPKKEAPIRSSSRKTPSPHRRNPNASPKPRSPHAQQRSPSKTSPKRSPTKGRRSNEITYSDDEDQVNYRPPDWNFPDLKGKKDSKQYWKEMRDKHVADKIVNV